MEYVKKNSKFFGWLHNAQVTKLMESKVATLRTFTVKTHREKIASLGVHNELKLFSETAKIGWEPLQNILAQVGIAPSQKSGAPVHAPVFNKGELLSKMCPTFFVGH